MSNHRSNRTQPHRAGNVTALSAQTRTGPKKAVRMAADLKNATGVEPTITAIGPARWQLVLENRRIRLTIDYAAKQPGASAVQVDTALYEDGKQRPIAKSFDDFVKIFTSAEDTGHVSLSPMPPVADVAGAPTNVHALYGSLHARVADAAYLGFDGERWVIGVDLDDRTGLRITFTQSGSEWAIRGKDDFQVIVNGIDVTSQAAGDLTKALALLAEPLASAEPGKGPISGARRAQVKRVTSVQVRNTTVIRN